MTNFNDHRLPDRFWDKVIPEPNSGCWLWLGALGWNGYGRFGIEGNNRLAHRVAYERLIAVIPVGLEIDHLCRVRCCVNPLHMEAVTRLVNVMRGASFAAANANATHCPHGHKYTGQNLRIRSNDGARVCRACCREFNRRRRMA